MTLPIPPSDWIQDQAQALSSDKAEDAVGALAWNLSVAFRRWSDAQPPALSDDPSLLATDFTHGAPALVMVLHGAIGQLLKAQHQWHETHGTPVTFGVDYGAINELQRVYDLVSAQASQWGEFIPKEPSLVLREALVHVQQNIAFELQHSSRTVPKSTLEDIDKIVSAALARGEA
jgi:hypothetical protein